MWKQLIEESQQKNLLIDHFKGHTFSVSMQGNPSNFKGIEISCTGN